MKHNHTSEFDFVFDKNWLLKSSLKDDWTQNKVNNLLAIEKEYSILSALEKYLSDIKKTLMMIIPNDEEKLNVESINNLIEMQKQKIQQLEKFVTKH